jgi:rhodanese-related sulfurtransferase
MKNVYIVNRSAHDFSAAEPYGNVIFLSEGSMNRYATNSMVRQFDEAMAGSTEEDYIVPCSLNVMNSIACAIFAHKHGKLNLLLFKDGKYIERNHIL